MESIDNTASFGEQRPHIHCHAGQKETWPITVELVCKSFEQLEEVDMLLLKRLQEFGISDKDIQEETDFSFTDATGHVTIDIDSVESVIFPVVVGIGLNVTRQPSESVSVAFNLMDGRKFPVRLSRRASLQDLKLAAERTAGIPLLQQELFLGCTKIDDIEAPLLGENSEVVEITLVKSRMGHAASLVKQFQAASVQERECAIEALCRTASNGNADPQVIVSCLEEMESRGTAEPAFLQALQTCLSDMASQQAVSDDEQPSN